MAWAPALSSNFVAAHQRRRVIGAVAELAHEFGIEEVTVTAICRVAQVDRGDLYKLFGNRSGCLRYAFAEAFERIIGPAREAGAASSEPWLARLNAALEVFFAAIAAEPLLAELCLAHSAGAAALSAGHDFEAGVEAITASMLGGRAAGEAARGEAHRDPAPMVEDFLARSVISLATMRVVRGEADRLPEDRDELVLLGANAFFGIEEGARQWRELAAAD